MSKIFKLLMLTSFIITVILANQSWASHGHGMGHDVAQTHKKDAAKPIEILWPRKNEVVKAKSIEVRIKVSDELKEMLSHIHVYVNGKRLDHASLKEDTLLLWNLKEGENKVELVLAEGKTHDEHSGGKIINDSVTFKVKTK